MEAIRKATSCRVIDLLDAFVANGVIEALINILDEHGIKELKQIEDTHWHDRTEDENDLREI